MEANRFWLLGWRRFLPREAAYVKSHGCRVFEDRLVELDPDLTDVFRSGIT